MTWLQADGLSFAFDHLGLMHSDADFTPRSKQEKNKKAMSKSPSRPMEGVIRMGTSSTFDRLMVYMCEQKAGASSSSRLQLQLPSTSLGLTPVLGSVSDVRGMFTDRMTGVQELRRGMTKRINRLEERGSTGP